VALAQRFAGLHRLGHHAAHELRRLRGREGVAHSERRWITTVWRSLGSTRLMPAPSARSSSRVRSTMSLQSRGVMEKRWSGPSRPLSSVKCFSTALAPSATAPSTAAWPGVWSLRPSTAPGNISRYVASTRRCRWLKFSMLPV
jgi:hypothetical protein